MPRGRVLHRHGVLENSPVGLTMPSLQIMIPDTYLALPLPPSSTPPSSWTNPHSPSRRAVSSLPSPISPEPQRGETSHTRSVDSLSPPIETLEPSGFVFERSHEIGTGESSSPRPLSYLYEPFEPPSPSVASLVDLAAHRRSRTYLMGEEFHVPSPVFLSPIPPVEESSPPFSVASTHRSLQSVPTSSASPPKSPPSATALSVPVGESSDRYHSDASNDDMKKLTSPAHRGSSETGQAQTHHSVFYMRDEMVVLDVDGCLYRVHRHLLERNSDLFRRLLLGHQNGGSSSGSTDDTAISLPDVTQAEFDCLLNFLYYRVFEDDAVSLNEWVTLLDVSTRLRFSKIRTCAIREISAQRGSLTSVEIIVLATKHDVPGWLTAAYADLCRRPHPLDDLEAEHLGARITARIGRARETIREETVRAFQQKKYGNRYTPPDGPEDELVSRVVMDVFWLEDTSNHI